MSRSSIGLDPALQEYLLDRSLREPDVLRRLREATAELPMARMQIAPEQGQFMAFLLRLMGARKGLEVGVFTGYSSLVAALAMGPGCRIVACDHNVEWTDIARRYWADAGVAERIDLRLGEALDTLEALCADPAERGSYDFAFVDADKTNYRAYYEAALELVRPGGVIALDNTLWSGRVAEPPPHDADTAAIDALNAQLADDERIDLSLVPIGDGLTLCRRRGEPAGVTS